MDSCSNDFFKELTLERGVRIGKVEKLSNKVLSAGDPLLPDPLGSSGAFILPQSLLHLQGATSVPTASLLLTEVCRVQEAWLPGI